METVYIDIYTIEVDKTANTKAGDPVNAFIKVTEGGKFVTCYPATWYADDTVEDVARRAIAAAYHFDLLHKSSDRIRASIKVNAETWEQAQQTLRELLDEPEPRRPYYLERLIAALNLCSDIAKHRAKLEHNLQRAIQSGK